MKKVYRLKDLDCANCAAKMERGIAKIDVTSPVFMDRFKIVCAILNCRTPLTGCADGVLPPPQ